MDPIFKNMRWSLDLPSPWQIRNVGDHMEITQPEGTGVMHISTVQKKEGVVSDAETLAQLKRNCPSDAICEKVRCGDFAGYVAAYVDWTTSRSWRIWSVACGSSLLHIIYACWRGEEDLEADDASALLQLLRAQT